CVSCLRRVKAECACGWTQKLLVLKLAPKGSSEWKLPKATWQLPSWLMQRELGLLVSHEWQMPTSLLNRCVGSWYPLSLSMDYQNVFRWSSTCQRVSISDAKARAFCSRGMIRTKRPGVRQAWMS